MTTATNRPHSPAAPTVRPHKPVHQLTAAPHRESLPHRETGAPREAHPVATTLVDNEYVGSPYCEPCATDDFIHLEAFVPAEFRHDGTLRTLGEATYFCAGCGDFSGHSVPASWVPPGWYFG